MIKTVEVIVIIALLIFSFFLGVKYSNSVKSHMSWLETQDEQEVELPDLSNESNGEVVGGPSDADINNPPALDNVNVDSSGQPLPAEGAIDESTPQAVEPVAVPVPANAPVNQAR